MIYATVLELKMSAGSTTSKHMITMTKILQI